MNVIRTSLFCACLLAIHGAAGAEAWMCVRADGATELRDSPCGDGPFVETRRYEFGARTGRGTFNSYSPTEPASRPVRSAAPAEKRRVRRPQPPGNADTEMQCARHQMRVRAINRRLRKGYSADEGNELRAERRRIEELLARACR